MAFAFELMQDGGLMKPKARPEGILKTYINWIKDVKEVMLWRAGSDYESTDLGPFKKGLNG